MKFTINSKAELNNEIEIPYLGLGVYLAGPGTECQNAVGLALDFGYRHIDTARMYGNEEDVGKAVLNSTVPREEVFITTKLWNDDHGYDKALKAFDKSLSNLGLDYVDLFLIHWPVEGLRLETWKAFEEIYKGERCKAIGVSNFTVRHLKELLENSEVVPAVNQVEFSPFLYQKELLDFCNDNNIMLEAYSPLTKGNKLDDPELKSLSNKYGKSTAQILIRWCLQHQVVVIPKSSSKEHIRENAEVFDFEIEPGDMEILDSLNRDYRSSWDPSNIK